MRIKSVETYPVRVGVKPGRIMITALGRHIVSNYLLVRVVADNGLEGAGEATVMPLWSGETLWGAQAIIEHVFKPAILDADPTDIAGIDARLDKTSRHNWFAKAALEMACWDLYGKSVGKPVYELLGGAKRPLAVRSRFSMGAYDVPRARERAQELVAEGFTTIKVKTGGKMEDDLARVRAVRETIGPNIALTIDSNCGWDVDTAIACVNALDDCNLALVEQPTPDGDYGGMARLRRQTKPPVMADDMVFDLIHAKELVRNECCDVISVYPGKNGGIRKSKQIADFAAEHGVMCSIGSNLELDIATAAMAHLVVGCQNMQVEKFPGDMLGPSYHEVSVLREPIKIDGPITTITDRPGLGIEVDWKLVESLAPKD